MPLAPELGIRLRGVTKTFGATVALRAIDLDVPAGSYVALMGANGAGKSTLLKIVAGLAVPTKGTVTIAGVEMRRAGPRLRAQVGVVAHESMLYPDLSGRENLRFHAKLFGVRDAETAIGETSTLLGVDRVLDRPVRALSRGTKQRVALTRALLHRPSVILLDEPYTGLDEAASAALSSLLEDLATPDRVVLVTVHDVARAISGPRRLLVLSDGRVVLDAPTDERETDVADTYHRLLHAEAVR